MTTTKEFKARKRRHFKRMLIQKLIGIVMLIITYIIIKYAMCGTTVVEKDATAILFTAPFGLYLLFTKHLVLTF